MAGEAVSPVRRDTAREANDAFRAFVSDAGFPCLAGKGVVRQEGYQLGVYPALGSTRAAAPLARDLAAFLAAPPGERARFRAFVAIFRARPPESEVAFERRLWRQLQLLHDHDGGTPWDAAAAADPDDPHFSFSFAGHALFVVGLHVRSSRLARRFRWPTLVFNPHVQFERLRAEGRFDGLRRAIREREIALQGTLNPNLADFGERSEARQYSGRATEAGWHCPFQHRDS